MLQRAPPTIGAQPCFTRETVLHILNRYWMSLHCATGTGLLVALSMLCGQGQRYGLLAPVEYLASFDVNHNETGFLYNEREESFESMAR